MMVKHCWRESSREQYICRVETTLLLDGSVIYKQRITMFYSNTRDCLAEH
jgi:hypothetical protein